MKINRHNLKRLRKDKLWSQEQLAEASCLSLRTIQRIESSGVASMDSIGAIASAFDVNKSFLTQEEAIFKPYQHTQLGYLMWVICFLVLALISPLPGMPMVGLVILFVGAIVPMILFFSLSISVTEERVRWYFGPRFWKKELSVSEIASSEVVRNSALMGWGIRMLGDGWMYNVSGLLAVEIRLKSGSVIRLGSDEPNYLKEAIDGAIALQQDRAD
ncbi:helix-turn-helix transcriptional regulator [uncultured Pseudoteredinibacter sp.]|uniref:helix-turn-helix domain-containing protein n=1 Tax=uncultured Pseudoteredinibacter sp. TaxID=1641701 RepID=UPI00260F2648|nr:helix-turn-helix transcriptional regulator [uncultured Pseudoteredinibacter sp.]